MGRFFYLFRIRHDVDFLLSEKTLQQENDARANSKAC